MLSKDAIRDRADEINLAWHRKYKCSGIKYCENHDPLIFGSDEVFNRVDPEIFSAVPLHEGKRYTHKAVSDLDQKYHDTTLEYYNALMLTWRQGGHEGPCKYKHTGPKTCKFQAPVLFECNKVCSYSLHMMDKN